MFLPQEFQEFSQYRQDMTYVFGRSKPKFSLFSVTFLFSKFCTLLFLDTGPSKARGLTKPKTDFSKNHFFNFGVSSKLLGN